MFTRMLIVAAAFVAAALFAPTANAANKAPIFIGRTFVVPASRTVSDAPYKLTGNVTRSAQIKYIYIGSRPMPIVVVKK